MLTCSFNHADMQVSTQANWHTVHTNMEHRFPPCPSYNVEVQPSELGNGQTGDRDMHDTNF